jgi:oligoendopeptidase F
VSRKRWPPVINGVKGETLILDKKRGREDNVHASIDFARIDRATLEAMLGAMKDSFPMFRRISSTRRN